MADVRHTVTQEDLDRNPSLVEAGVEVGAVLELSQEEHDALVAAAPATEEAPAPEAAPATEEAPAPEAAPATEEVPTPEAAAPAQGTTVAPEEAPAPEAAAE